MYADLALGVNSQKLSISLIDINDVARMIRDNNPYFHAVYQVFEETGFFDEVASLDSGRIFRCHDH